MNEKDLEKRLRDVTSGPAPVAPQSLRTFLRQLPEKEAARRRGPLGALRHALSALPSLAPRLPAAQKLQLAAAVSLAAVLSVVGAGLLLSLRQTARQPLASPSGPTSSPTTIVTPRRTTPSTSVLEVKIDENPYWYGTTRYGNDDEALPIETAARPDGAYVGISAAPYGLNGIVRSDMGLFWDWSPLSEVDANLGGLTSIAADTTGRMVVVGWSSTSDGIKDGRAYYSDDGYTWHPAANQVAFLGTVVRKVVHGPQGFVALGWNDGSQADEIRPIAEWVSGDGVSWTRVSGVPIRGTSALVVATGAGYVLSGSPIRTGTVDEPPIWYSTDGASWTRATATDNSAQKMGPLVGATLLGGGTLVALSGLGDGMSKQFVQSTDGGHHWHQMGVQGFADPALVTHVASVSGGDMSGSWLVATYSGDTGRLYVSKDGGWTWKSAVGYLNSPLGTMLVEVGPGYGATNRRVLAFGEPAEHLDIWLASAEELAWP
jgi:hypothetical protein